MPFFRTFFSLFRSPLAYFHAVQPRFWFTLRFFAKAYLLFFVVTAAALFAAASSFVDDMARILPDDFSATYENGTLTLIHSPSAPLILAPLFSFTRITLREKQMEITALKKESVSLEYTKLFPSELSQFTITKSDITQHARTTFFTAGFAVLALLWGVVFLSRLVWAAVYAVFFTSLDRIFGNDMRYEIMLQFCMLATIAAETLNLIYIGIYRSAAFPLFDLAFFVIMVIILRSRPQRIVKTA